MKPKKQREYFYSFYFQNQLHLLQYDEKPSEDDGQYRVYLESYDKSLIKVGEERAVGQLFPYLFTFDVGSLFRSYFSRQHSKMRRSFFYNHKTSADQKKLALFFNYVLTSFAFTHDVQGYYLLFNNRIRNTSDVSLVSITPHGDISLETLFDRSSYRLRAVPAFATSVTPGLLTFPVEKNNKQAVATVAF